MGGEFENSVVVTISLQFGNDVAAGGTVHFTTTGANPTPASQLYTGPFILNSSAVISAVHVIPGSPNIISTVATAVFVQVGIFITYPPSNLNISHVAGVPFPLLWTVLSPAQNFDSIRLRYDEKSSSGSEVSLGLANSGFFLFVPPSAGQYLLRLETESFISTKVLSCAITILVVEKPSWFQEPIEFQLKLGLPYDLYSFNNGTLHLKLMSEIPKELAQVDKRVEANQFQVNNISQGSVVLSVLLMSPLRADNGLSLSQVVKMIEAALNSPDSRLRQTTFLSKFLQFGYCGDKRKQALEQCDLGGERYPSGEETGCDKFCRTKVGWECEDSQAVVEDRQLECWRVAVQPISVIVPAGIMILLFCILLLSHFVLWLVRKCQCCIGDQADPPRLTLEDFKIVGLTFLAALDHLTDVLWAILLAMRGYEEYKFAIGIMVAVATFNLCCGLRFFSMAMPASAGADNYLGLTDQNLAFPRGEASGFFLGFLIVGLISIESTMLFFSNWVFIGIPMKIFKTTDEELRKEASTLIEMLGILETFIEDLPMLALQIYVICTRNLSWDVLDKGALYSSQPPLLSLLTLLCKIIFQCNSLSRW